MCGIVGLVDFSAPLGEQTRQLLVKASDRLATRGPDSSGLWNSPCSQVVLAHRRLAIIDLSPGGIQPMHLAGERFSIVFNGEIYNYRSLRAELEPHHQFRSHSDTVAALGC